MTHTVQLEPSGRQFSTEDNESILDAAMRQGIQLEYGCRDGRCGTCHCTLLSGDISYPEGRPERLTDEDEAASTILICKAPQ